MREPQRARSNRRADLRKAVLWSASLATARGPVDCRIINISTTGAKLRAAVELRDGEHVTLAIRSLGEFHCTVVWVRDGHIGVQFVEQKLAEGQAADTTIAAGGIGASGEEPGAGSQSAEEPAIAEPAPAQEAPPAAQAESADTTGSKKTSDPSPRTPRKPARDVRQLISSAASVQIGDPALTLDPRVRSAVAVLHPDVNAQIDPKAIVQLSRADLRWQLVDLVNQVAQQKKLALSSREQDAVIESILNEMVGLGPLEPLLADEFDHRYHGQRRQAGLCRAPRQARTHRTSPSATIRTS